MTPITTDRLMSPAATALFGVLLAGTVAYVVQTLLMPGEGVAPAILVAAFWGVGLAALWALRWREQSRTRTVLEVERSHARLYRRLVDEDGTAYLVLDEGGRVGFTSPNLARLLGADPGGVQSVTNVLDLLDPADHRRALQEFARLRKRRGGTVSFDVAPAGLTDRDIRLRIRATNLLDDAAVGGILLQVRDVSLRRAFEKDLQHLAYYDALTGLASRRFFIEQGRQALGLARRNRRPVCCLRLNLDRFGQVNELLGPDAGDELLRRVADSLRRAVRSTDLVARLGSDEFAILLTEVRSVGAAGQVAGRIIEGLPLSAAAGGHEVLVTAGIGVAIYPEDATELEALLDAAGEALHRSKAEDPAIQYHRPEVRALPGDRLRVEEDMRRGLERHEFQLYYQPVFDLATGSMVGAEALSRWRHFTRGMVAAAEFIELAEGSGMVRALDRWALARAVRQRAGRGAAAFPGWVAVNLSVQSLLDESLPAFLYDLMHAHAVLPGDLVLELSDAAVGIDPAAAARRMAELRQAGAAIALDDYGAGPTSFARLRSLPVDIVKLDPEFVAGVGRGEGEERFADAAIAAAHGLGARVLAKGVERPEQADWLRAAGCDLVQGYLLSVPLSPEDLLRRAS